MTTPEPEPKKPRRKRKTKAEKETERLAKMKAEAEKPIDPRIWLSLGSMLLIVGLCIYIDPVGFEQAEANSNSNNTTWLQIILVMLLAFFGKNPVTIALGVMGGLSLAWGIRGWLREKSGADKNA
jgi:hypothetical protein